ncbi:MAG: MBL fold metallo-hydrolase [Syntrophales bacterium]|jgi:glyoxylase-like metal-dependent hydrolase (beta-lactamase superfamily II)|nr:MBL fold metallo-hydrolase [Syntrophales bacterium]MDY0043974.1 MBL fold metallo-hydrolase [Syntrophales bacterium]
MIHQPLEDLFLIDLDQPKTGFRKFISSWLYVTKKMKVLVDPGPGSTIPVLLSALTEIGIDRLDIILITHIHIDHVGGLGLLLREYPDATVLCHRQAVRHLVDPSKLWKGSLEVLGSLARLYGSIEPVPQKNIASETWMKEKNLAIETIETPGHASHHVCYCMNDILFTGEAAGVICPLNEGLYLRTASPARFVYEKYKKSVLKMAQVKSSYLCFAHYGCLRRDQADYIFDAACEQLDIWLDIIERCLRRGIYPVEEHSFAEILEKDPWMRSFKMLPPDIQQRERHFIANSIRGMTEYLVEKGKQVTSCPAD